MSIGELLNVLKDEFPDVTVSKIRFLESEGLISPERTSSGYRKFSPLDVERLRFILRQQRDHFLPLKVIRERLAVWEASGESGAHPATLFSATPDAVVDAGSPVDTNPAAAPQPAAAEPDPLAMPMTGLSMSKAELERTASLSATQIEELESFGLLSPAPSADGEPRYDEIDVEIAKLCRELIRIGLEPRHLRMFRSTADRMTSLADQMVLPLVKQRNPEARRQAADTVRELVRVGNRLLQALLREGLKQYHG